MKTINEYLENLKEKRGSYYKVARELKISDQAISTIRKGGGAADETAIKIANALGIEQEEVLIAAAIERSHGEVRTTWEKISRLSGIAACFIFMFHVVMIEMPNPTGHIMYIM